MNKYKNLKAWFDTLIAHPEWTRYEISGEIVDELEELLELASKQEESKPTQRVANINKPSCLCDLCRNGIPHLRACYLCGVERCVKNGIYTMFELREDDRCSYL